MSPSVKLRPPRAAAAAAQEEHQGHPPPSLDWLAGTWHVTHSTLPMWKSKRNVRITYTPHSVSSGPVKIDDLVTYQTLGSDKVKTVLGVDTVCSEGDMGVWDWRGKGWLMIASSHWEVLGWGELEENEVGEGETPQWVVTYFSKTLFTPAGIDIYSRRKGGVGVEAVEEIKKALKAVPDETVKKLVDSVFEVTHN